MFSIKGFINPPTIKTSDSFSLAIFYIESIDEVARSVATDLTITALPSPMIRMSVDLSS